MKLFQVGGISLFRELLSSDIDKCIFDLVIFFKFFFMLFYIVGSMIIYYSFLFIVVLKDVKCFLMIYFLRYCKILY